jgi:hypothetical protein
MPFVPAAGVVSMAAIWSLDNQNVENTFNYHVGATIDIAKLTAMATTYATWANTNKIDWPNNCQLLKLYLRDLTTQSGAVEEFVPVSAIVGTKTGTPLPNQVAFAIKRQTGLAGRKNRGRLYQFGITDTDRSDDNHIATSRVLAWITHYNTLLASQASDNGAAEVILHRATGTYTAVLGYNYADLTIDCQRRRLPDHNRHH